MMLEIVFVLNFRLQISHLYLLGNSICSFSAIHNKYTSHMLYSKWKDKVLIRAKVSPNMVGLDELDLLEALEDTKKKKRKM